MTALPMLIDAPGTDEYDAYYNGYISRVPAGTDILALLASQREETQSRLRAIPESRGAHRYAPANGA